MTCIKLNLGCGTKPMAGYINIDMRDLPGVDLIHDVSTGLEFQDNSVDEIRAYDFLEHVSHYRVRFLIEEIWRVLKPGGIFESSTPSTDGRGAFQNPTHISFWNYNSWLYWMQDELREEIGTNAKFEGIINDQQTGFKVVHTYARLKAVKR